MPSAGIAKSQNRIISICIHVKQHGLHMVYALSEKTTIHPQVVWTVNWKTDRQIRLVGHIPAPTDEPMSRISCVYSAPSRPSTCRWCSNVLFRSFSEQDILQALCDKTRKACSCGKYSDSAHSRPKYKLQSFSGDKDLSVFYRAMLAQSTVMRWLSSVCLWRSGIMTT